jgi:serine/threonine protein kinase/tetratricopeptide (TPR) repeat protein
MTPERWEKIKRLFHAALDYEPTQRATFLAQASVDDEALRNEVASLLASHEQAESFIETPASDLAAELLGTQRSTYEPDHQIQNYRILGRLGSGGMGEVYLADDTRLKRKVALKLLPPHFTVNPDRVRRFEREARAASALNHPNIVTIYEIGQSDSAHFIATEFVDGKTLRQMINEKPLKLSETLNVAIQVAGALMGAHAAGIVHRDIKPENIMVRPDDYIKILDFGLAKLTELQTTETETETPTLLQSNPGLVMGTVQYMSPEQARGRKVDARSDIWSFGVVLYELLAGRVPFSGETPSHVMVSLMEDELPPLTGYVNVPAELDRIVSKALRKSPRERYQTASDLAHDLKNLKQELQLETRLKEVLDVVPTSRGVTEKNNRARSTGAQRTGAQVSALARTATETVALQSRETSPHPPSSAGYLVNEIKGHKRALALVAIAMVIAVMGVYLFITRKTNVASASDAIDSVAVLPFVNVNNDPNAEYLADGISDSIISSLSQLPNLKKVSAFSSVMRYKGKQTDPQTVGRDLNVRAVLVGRLTQRGDDLSISAELVDVRYNTRLWQGQFDRKLADVLKLRGDIAQEISDGLRLKLTSMEKQQLAKSSTTNPEADQLYLLGRFHQHNREEQKARDYLERAIKKDPNYAPAYAQLAYTYSTAVYSDDWSTRKDAQERMERAAQRALQLDDTLGDAHAALALTILDWSVRPREFQRALELDPNSADIHAYYARVLWSHRRIDEAILQMKRAVELDPFSPTSQADLGKILYSAGQRDQALEQYRKALDLNPNYGNAYKHLASYYLAEGRYEEAIAAAEKMRANVSDGRSFLAYTYAVAGKRAEAEKILHDLQEEAKQRHVGSEKFALIYTGLGDKDRAFEFLQKEVEENKVLPIHISVLPEWGSLRTDPRFEVLIQQSEWHRE